MHCDTVKHNFKQSFKQDFTPYSTHSDGHGQVCNGEIHQSRDSQQKSVPCNGLNEKHGTIPPSETVNKTTKHTAKKPQAFVKFSSNVEVSLTTFFIYYLYFFSLYFTFANVGDINQMFFKA